MYAIAINVYSFLLLKFQKDGYDEGECENTVRDGKIFLTSLLGGGIGIYTSMFAFKYRLKSMFFMVFTPVIIVFNCYLFFLAITSNFWF